MKKIVHARGLRDVKSIHSAGIRSIPKAQRSAYLELFILAQEKERLAKEHFLVSARNNSLHKQLQSVKRRMNRVQEDLAQDEDKAGLSLNKRHKKMKVKY